MTQSNLSAGSSTDLNLVHRAGSAGVPSRPPRPPSLAGAQAGWARAFLREGL
ncbi:MAG: hypothetical protein Q8O26_12535 [Phreatobacter sp.]|uniref:hypothetical protein n=1 Tax=Phreatobacter sp. TaxID=1966341 RepID=UPI0027347054|nr:hypothetical protein [Phreatobacter sp.]MDP2802699.1 hypothetical protein [Phreatobacter sp.]